MKSTVYKSKDLKNLEDEENPLDPINQACRRLKDFLNAYRGFNRCDIQGLINLYVFIDNTPNEYLKKIDLLIQYALKNKTLLRYRYYQPSAGKYFYLNKECSEEGVI